MQLPLLDADPKNRRGHSLLILCLKRLGKVYQHLKKHDQAIEAYEAGA